MSDNQNIPEVGAPIPPNAVSIYGQGDAMDDFPVLKAFQQYVDAEHAKAQKRMITLCIFFVVLMVSVIGVFVALLMNISSRNNSLSDQLFQYMLKDRDRQNVFVQSPAPAQNDTAIKALTEMQQKMMEQQMNFAAELMKNSAKVQAAIDDTPVPQSERQAFAQERRKLERDIRAENEKLQRAQAELKAEQERMAKEREILKQREIDLQHRKLYPELYEQPSARKQPKQAERNSSRRSAQRYPDDQDLSDLDAELEAEERSLNNGKADGSIRYFSYDDDDDLDEFVDSLEIPARTPSKPNRTKVGNWDIPLD